MWNTPLANTPNLGACPHMSQLRYESLIRSKSVLLQKNHRLPTWSCLTGQAACIFCRLKCEMRVDGNVHDVGVDGTVYGRGFTHPTAW